MTRVPLLMLLFASLAAAAQNLIVCDEMPAMENLARQLETRLHESSEIVSQTQMPPSLEQYRNVIVYVHQDIVEPAEIKFIEYAKGGGNLILLHHSISSGKRKNKYWFPFLGVSLPEKPFADGGYKYIDDVTWVVYSVDNPAKQFTMHDTEIYLNQVYDSARTFLLGLRYKTVDGKEFDQQTAGWKKRTEKGTVFYFMPGHKASDFEYEPYVAELMKAAR